MCTEIAPLQVADADEMFDVLSDPRIYTFLDEAPPASKEALRERYKRLSRQASPDGKEWWLNWVVREPRRSAALGYVQATVYQESKTAEIGYVLAPSAWGRGHAREAVGSMLAFLDERLTVTNFRARVHPHNERSLRLLSWFGFARDQSHSHSDLSFQMQLHPYRSQFGWEGDGGLGERLIARILEGKKTASAGPKDLYSKKELSRLFASVGQPATIMDSQGRPRGSIVMRDVFETPFGAPHAALVAGEGFGTDAAAFQASHRRTWKHLVDAGQLRLSSDTPLIAELFSLATL